MELALAEKPSQLAFLIRMVCYLTDKPKIQAIVAKRIDKTRGS